jgi:hypothetical protein
LPRREYGRTKGRAFALASAIVRSLILLAWPTTDFSSNQNYIPLERQASLYKPFETYVLEKEKQYQQQYGDMYFLRLAKLKPVVERIAGDAWEDFQIGGEQVERVERVLDVRQGKLCWVAGTIYMEMPLKPNILDDISKDVSGNKADSVVYDTDNHSTGSLPLHQGRSISLRMVKILLCWKMNLEDFD